MVQPKKKKPGTQNSPFGQDGLCGELGGENEPPLSGSKACWRGIPLRGALLCGYPSINVKFQALSSPLSTKERTKASQWSGSPRKEVDLGKFKCAIHLSWKKIIFSQWRKFSMIRIWYSIFFFLFYCRTFIRKKSAFLRHFFQEPHNWQGKASQPKQHSLFFKAWKTPKRAFLLWGQHVVINLRIKYFIDWLIDRSIIILQWCVSFKNTTKWFWYILIYILFQILFQYRL